MRKKPQLPLKLGFWMGNTVSFEHGFQGEWSQIMPCQHFYSSYIPAVDFSHAETKTVMHGLFMSFRCVSGRKQICHIFHSSVYKFKKVIVMLFKVMLSIKFLHLEQLASVVSFEFSFTEFSSSSLAWVNIPVLSLKYFGSNWVCFCEVRIFVP